MSKTEVDVETCVSTTEEALAVASSRRNSGAGEFPARIYPDGLECSRATVVENRGGLEDGVMTALSASPNNVAIIVWPE